MWAFSYMAGIAVFYAVRWTFFFSLALFWAHSRLLTHSRQLVKLSLLENYNKLNHSFLFFFLLFRSLLFSFTMSSRDSLTISSWTSFLHFFLYIIYFIFSMPLSLYRSLTFFSLKSSWKRAQIGRMKKNSQSSQRFKALILLLRWDFV